MCNYNQGWIEFLVKKILYYLQFDNNMLNIIYRVIIVQCICKM